MNLVNPSSEDRINEAIQELVECAEEHEIKGCKCDDFRTGLVAELFAALDLSLVDLGYVAEKYMDIICGEPPPVDQVKPETSDEVLDAKEIGE